MAREKREFLLKFSKDRLRYMRRLYQARKRYELAILNYIIASSHVHLLVVGTGKRDVIAKSTPKLRKKVGKTLAKPPEH